LRLLILAATDLQKTASGFGALYDKTDHLVYRGDVVNGKAEGKGTLYLPNGEIIREWQTTYQ
jgi:hypothetical protein